MGFDSNILLNATEFILSLRDQASGGFAFAKGNQPTLMGTCYAIHALEFLDSLNSLSSVEREKTVGFIMNCCRKDGTFQDPLFKPFQIATRQHDEDYFLHESTCFAQNALDAMGAPSPPKRDFPKSLLTASGLEAEFDSYNWGDPHLNSNRVMFWMAQFAHEVERHHRVDLLSLIDAGLDWIDAHQSSETGLWSGPVKTGLSEAMAATFHYTFFYFYRKRPLMYPERIIDSCLSLQKEDGLFSRGESVGQTCLDYDAIDLLAKASLLTEYRLQDVIKAFFSAKSALMRLANEDGGFANIKKIRVGNTFKSASGLYHTGLTICSCDNTESNSFSTWFRLLALSLCSQFEWINGEPDKYLRFRRLPWLGHNDVNAIRSLCNNYKCAYGSIYTKYKDILESKSPQNMNNEHFSQNEIERGVNMSVTGNQQLDTGFVNKNNKNFKGTSNRKGVSVIIVSNNSNNQLDKLLSSFFEVNTYSPIEVVIVDRNGSTNINSLAAKYAKMAFIKIIRQTEKNIFSELLNIVADNTMCSFFLIINKDIFYCNDILEKALKELKNLDIDAVKFVKNTKNKWDFQRISLQDHFKSDIEEYPFLCSKSFFQSKENKNKENMPTNDYYFLPNNDLNKIEKQGAVEGSIEELKDGKLLGWIANSNNYNKSLNVTLFIDDQEIIKKNANLYRNDIQISDIYSGKHGFKLDVPLSYCDGRSHFIIIEAIENNALVGSLKTNMYFSSALPFPKNIKKFPITIKNKPKVSIVVPAFNVEEFLAEALLSLIEHNMHDMEIIVINDGSTDNTGQICEYYAHIDKRIRYIELFKNRGYGYACNLGIKASSGYYLSILEPDDFVDRKTYKHAYEEASKNDLDWVRFGFILYSNGEIRESSYYKVLNQHKVPFNRVININEFPGLYPSQPTVWGFLYKRNFLIDNNIWFLETPGASYQDNSFWYKILSLSKKVMLLDKQYYYYRQHPGQSINNVTKVNAPIDELKEMRDFCNSVIKKQYPEEKYKTLYLQVINRSLDYFNLHFKRLRLDLKPVFYENFQLFLYETLFSNKNVDYYYKKLISRRAEVFNQIKSAKTYGEYLYQQGLYPVNGDLKILEEKIKDQMIPVERLTPPFQHMFYGYFDIKAMDYRCNSHLAIKVPFMHRLPKADDMADICLIDRLGNIETVANTNCWNFQQGCFLQFLPSSDKLIIYNIFDEKRNNYGSVIYDISDKKVTKILPLPIASISPNGNEALSINFSRLYDYRPGYGYSNIKDPHFNEIAPSEDGIFIMDLETGEKRLLVSYHTLWEKFSKGTSVENDKILVNHINFNTDGSKIIFLLRYFSNTAPWPTTTVVMDSNGTNIKKIFGFGSHYHWKNSEELVISGEDIFYKEDRKKMTAYNINSITGEYYPIDKQFFSGDGHCSYSPKRRYLLYDSYSTIENPYKKLMIYDINLNKGIVLGQFFSDHNLYHNIGDIRCDLHPRWSANGEYITFDSIHEGFRGIYRIKVKDAIKQLNKNPHVYIKKNENNLDSLGPYIYSKSKVNNPKVSIALPLYNTANYLPKCLDSVINQSLKDIEIILIDDCSPDNSIDIARNYQKIDDRIHIIRHPRNLGLGGVRNTSIYNAKAEYIGMIDSDDFIDKDMYKIMYNKAIENNVDMVVCGVKKVYENNSEKISNFVKYDKEQIITNCFDSYMRSNTIIPAVYQKLFRKDIYIKNKIFFPNNVYHQDIATIPKYVFYCNNILLLRESLYYYLQREGSAVSSISQKHIDSVFTVVRTVKQFLEDKGIYKKYKREFYEKIFYQRAIKYHLLRIANNSQNSKDMFYYIKESLNKVFDEVDIDDMLSIITKNDIHNMFK
jgi:glycosyltransferase involved in cell wall biosynthesis